MRTRFSGIYEKVAGVGFCGQKAIVRTPSLSEVLGIVCKTLISIDNPKEVFSGYSSLPTNELIERLIDDCYFGACMLDCGNDGCREWHQVYDLCDPSNIYCHVSECCLSPYPPESEPDDQDEQELNLENISVEDYIERLISIIVSDKLVVESCINPAVVSPGSVEYAIHQKGYAEALQDILNILRSNDRSNRQGKPNTDDI